MKCYGKRIAPVRFLLSKINFGYQEADFDILGCLEKSISIIGRHKNLRSASEY